MKLLYTVGVNLYSFFIGVFSLWNPKAKLLRVGRKESWKILKDFKNSGENVYWFHCASLGEFEQGRPIIEHLKEHENCQIIISFFSPSGYEIRKNYEHADKIFYLPKDSKKNAKRLFDIVQPNKVFFVKYEFWANYIFEAKGRNIPIYSVSAVFRENQVFFKWYGGYMRKILAAFDQIFVQETESKKFLNEIGVSSIVAGDTRFDRVAMNAKNVDEYPLVANWVKDKKVFICGSTWNNDIDVIAETIKNLDEGWKVIVAPHEIKEEKLSKIDAVFSNDLIRYSQIEHEILSSKKVLVIDNIGILMNLYQYANVAYVGGAFKTGLHNILEPASFGVPVIFGPNHAKFPEANLFIKNGIGFSISNKVEFQIQFDSVISNPINKKVVSFMSDMKGATKIILENIA